MTRTRIFGTRPLLAGGLVALLAACEGGSGSPGIGTVGGAAGGGLLAGSLARNQSQSVRIAAALGGALAGGAAGNRFIDGPQEQQRIATQEAARDREAQRQLDFQRQSALQQEQVRREIEEQRLFEEWRRQQAGGARAAAPATQQDIRSAQALLTSLGFYRGPISGQNGPQTQTAIRQFEASRGLPQTGQVTPSLLQQLRAAV
jgi:hypothetical protein